MYLSYDSKTDYIPLTEAVKLGYGKHNTLLQAIHRGKLKAEKFSRIWLVSEDSLKEAGFNK